MASSNKIRKWKNRYFNVCFLVYIKQNWTEKKGLWFGCMSKHGTRTASILLITTNISQIMIYLGAANGADCGHLITTILKKPLSQFLIRKKKPAEKIGWILGIKGVKHSCVFYTKFSRKIQELKRMVLDRFDKNVCKYFKWSRKIRKMVSPEPIQI